MYATPEFGALVVPLIHTCTCMRAPFQCPGEPIAGVSQTSSSLTLLTKGAMSTFDESLVALEAAVKNPDGVPYCTGTFPWDTKKSTLFYKSNEVEPKYVYCFLNVPLILIHALFFCQVPQFPGGRFSARESVQRMPTCNLRP